MAEGIHVGWILVYYYNPVCCNGGVITRYEIARWLQQQLGVIARVFTFINYDPAAEYEPHFLESAGKRLGIDQEIIPFSRKTMGERAQQEILRLVMKTIQAHKMEYVFTGDADFDALLAVTLLDIPGAHIFQSLSNISAYVQRPVSRGLLHKRDLFTISNFLRDQVKQLLGLNAEVWPVRPWGHDHHFVPNPGNNTKAVGYYSAGKHKGDEIVNTIVAKAPHLKVVIMGGRWMDSRQNIPENIEYLGEVTDVQRFYERITVHQ
jgi:hypothetical protein